MKDQLKAGQYCLTPDQVSKVINGVTDFRHRIIIKLGAFCGLRRDEIAKLHVQNIDFKNRRMWIPGKGKKRRLVPVPADVLAEVKMFIGKRKSGWVFPARKKKGYPLHPTAINRIVAAAGHAAGVKNPNPGLKHINPHCLRHSYARGLKDADVPPEAIQAVLGHTSIKTTMDTYGLMSANQIQESIEKAF